jgi:hypothetical protein
MNKLQLGGIRRRIVIKNHIFITKKTARKKSPTSPRNQSPTSLRKKSPKKTKSQPTPQNKKKS